MAEKAFRIFPQGIAASFDPIMTGIPLIDGDPTELSAAQNAPAADPESWLSRINFHSEFDYLAVDNANIGFISHGTITAGTNTGQGIVNSNFEYNLSFIDYAIYTHNLGYEPLALVSVNGNNQLVCPGFPAQLPVSANGSARFICPWVDTTNLYIREYQAKGSVDLASTYILYSWVIFERQPNASGDKVFAVDKDTGKVSMGFDRWQSTKRYLQVVAGGSPFGLAKGRTMDLKNGAYRFVLADGTTYDPITSDLKTAVAGTSEVSYIYGSSMEYNGSFTGAGSVQVQIP